MNKAKIDDILPDGILPVWQPVGYSTNRIAKVISDHFKVPMTHTGTLDPMAEGVVILLTGKERFKKHELTAWLKEYEFRVVFGLSTDSFDGLGYLSSMAPIFTSDINEDLLKNICKNLVGSYTQQVPLYSAVKHKGKKMFAYARENEKPELPLKSGTVHALDLLNMHKITYKELISGILNNIEHITGDFRQADIKEQWQNILNSLAHPIELTTASFRVKLTRGMYVRSLSQDICSKAGTVGFVISLVRTGNGSYSRSECFTLEELMGRSFNKELFVSNADFRS